MQKVKLKVILISRGMSFSAIAAGNKEKAAAFSAILKAAHEAFMWDVQWDKVSSKSGRKWILFKNLIMKNGSHPYFAKIIKKKELKLLKMEVRVISWAKCHKRKNRNQQLQTKNQWKKTKVITKINKNLKTNASTKNPKAKANKVV